MCGNKLGLISLFLVVIVSGCGKADSSGSSAGASTQSVSSIEGKDFSGSYVFDNVECYNSNFTANTHNDYFVGYSETITVSGNNLTATSTVGVCTVTITAHVVFTDPSVIPYTLTLTQQKVVSATAGSCTQTKAFSGSAITPTSSATSYYNGKTFSDLVTYPLWNPTNNALGIESNYSDGTSGGYCFQVFIKQ